MSMAGRHSQDRRVALALALATAVGAAAYFGFRRYKTTKKKPGSAGEVHRSPMIEHVERQIIKDSSRDVIEATPPQGSVGDSLTPQLDEIHTKEDHFGAVSDSESNTSYNNGLETTMDNDVVVVERKERPVQATPASSSVGGPSKEDLSSGEGAGGASLAVTESTVTTGCSEPPLRCDEMISSQEPFEELHLLPESGRSDKGPGHYADTADASFDGSIITSDKIDTTQTDIPSLDITTYDRETQDMPALAKSDGSAVHSVSIADESFEGSIITSDKHDDEKTDTPSLLSMPESVISDKSHGNSMGIADSSFDGSIITSDKIDTAQSDIPSLDITTDDRSTFIAQEHTGGQQLMPILVQSDGSAAHSVSIAGESFDASIITSDKLDDGQTDTPSLLSMPESIISDTSHGNSVGVADSSFDGSIITTDKIDEDESNISFLDNSKGDISFQESVTIPELIAPVPSGQEVESVAMSVSKEAIQEEQSAQYTEYHHPSSSDPAVCSESRDEKDIEDIAPADEFSTEGVSESDDPADSSVWVTKPESPDENIAFGMRIVTTSTDDKFRHELQDVEYDSPAYQVGLRGGDQLIRLNFMSVNEWAHDALLEQFRLVPTEDIDITIQRTAGDEQTFKELKARMKKTDDEGVAVSSEELEINESQLWCDRDIIIATYSGDDRKRVCRIQSAGNDVYIMAQGHQLTTGPFTEDREDYFTFRREMFNCIDKCPDSPYFQKPIYVFVFRAGRKGTQQGYITALNRGHVGLQHKDRLRRRMHSLSRADARFFIHHYSTSGFDCFESTQLPGHYLACDKDRVYLKWLSSEPERDNASEVHFQISYLTSEGARVSGEQLTSL